MVEDSQCSSLAKAFQINAGMGRLLLGWSGVLKVDQHLVPEQGQEIKGGQNKSRIAGYAQGLLREKHSWLRYDVSWEDFSREVHTCDMTLCVVGRTGKGSHCLVCGTEEPDLSQFCF